MTGTARLIVARGTPDSTHSSDTFEVPFADGQSVLDGLRWIRSNKDPSLAFRFSCISANACKECMMRIDGKTEYACLVRLEAREMLLEPLPNKELVRDLVTEIAPPAERLSESG
ncbi:MAG: 2Fe-2S iron-sulfur cluster-binding protein [Pseudomonadota bacterium]